MATLYTHAAFGLAAAKLCTSRRMPVLFWAVVGFLPVVPDFDVFSEAPYGTWLGHRGFTHSLLFALAIGLLAAGLTRNYFGVNLWLLVGLFTFITASHGVLDALTSGGEGIPFFWPLTNHRCGPWGPIHVSDIAFDFPDPRTSRAVRDELLWVWLPMTLLLGTVTAYRSRSRTGP